MKAQVLQTTGNAAAGVGMHGQQHRTRVGVDVVGGMATKQVAFDGGAKRVFFCIFLTYSC
eukprot:CAMPEP_0185855500 /NCGR_PEP_ID=MMETSP1354-20130828/25898_1 /TAXON_ID=708628 /ORGANISM="Erythrolobus madagascarensis, Strain CCMP3276" /LENGTH=59 /DNA_ID=CAMNT_0028557535 /DNA_START=112 /DNA_END=288 /DNA_ORIENTATION=+